MISDSDVVFQDMEDAARDILLPDVSPEVVRRQFARLLTLSQQLTAVLRREYHQKTGRRWEASVFSGWNPVSEFFKSLRSVDLHESPVRIKIHEIVSIPATAKLPTGTQKLKFEIHGDTAADPFGASVPNGLSVEFADGRQIEGVTHSHWFGIETTNMSLQKKLDNLPSQNLVELVSQYMIVMRDYREFFRATLGADEPYNVPGHKPGHSQP